ncbi:hypothetical protein F2P81_024150 [Scophthalmus maximus]|uniref:Uncharacterized protein n=1 Tax=Scophthalmus maximus TaxID=52904 RepID=A0A6A4RVX7_SCOMX|nr:hypothetical protein F2P81_024150 [Scophthalmus maximus]
MFRCKSEDEAAAEKKQLCDGNMRDPTTERHGGFGLLRFRPGPMHPSLDDLVVPGSPGSTISIPNLVRTPDRHSPLQLRSPELKRSARLSLPYGCCPPVMLTLMLVNARSQSTRRLLLDAA